MLIGIAFYKTSQKQEKPFMFKIIQSHRTENLVDELLVEYQSIQQSIFDPFVVIIPSMVLGDWLDKTIASRAGISTLVMTKFWGQYQWTLMQDVLNQHNAYLLQNNPDEKVLNVPEVAVLSSTVMQWRLFGYLTYYQQTIIEDDKHPVYPLLSPLIEEPQQGVEPDKAQQDARIWQLASDLARVFNRYLTHREDWLSLWSQNKPLNVEALIKEKDELSLSFDKYARVTPEWLKDHYVELETAQRYLWSHLFADVHQYRAQLEKTFWKALESNNAGEQDQLPKVLRIFTIQQLPQTELDFLQRLSRYMDIVLLHYNPSKLFWADIVDKSWLQRQQIINPESVFLRDYGHSLLSRLGKQSRDTFAMLANLSGNELYEDAIVDWQDKFEDDWTESLSDELGLDTDNESNEQNKESEQETAYQPHNSPSLLRRLQNDVLMLDERSTQQATAVKVSQAISEQIELSFDEADDDNTAAWYDDEVLKNKRFEKERLWSMSAQDNSLSIHSCHSLQRQLEVLRIMIGRWLNEPLPPGAKKRHISDIVVLLPDVERHHALISSIFVNGKGQDGLTLPARVTGVVDASIRQLWEAITGFYKLLGSDSARFEAAEVLDWLMLPPLYESFGLTHDQMSRGCDLLVEAGFIRGFDEKHLKQTLDDNDFDYRFSFAQALDRLTLGLIMPEAQMSDCLYPLEDQQWPKASISEMSLPLPEVSLNDAPIIEALCRIYSGLHAQRDDYKQKQKAEDWLNDIEQQVIHRYFGDVDQTRSMRAIYNAMNGFKSSLRANRHYRQYASGDNVNNREVEQRLANVENLPLKLSFMLDSIEAELESQQVSAEPTGVITFGRFGALRNVPFDLVVMLNMNLSEFPARDRDNRYDLMKATKSRPGDRVSEDDDNGAFLDALLCARSACWIFYNGQSLTDTHEHLPANPVSELLQFLQGEVQWQVNSLDSLPQEVDPTTESLKRHLPKLVKQWLVTEHPALPFDKSLFQQQLENDFTQLENSLSKENQNPNQQSTSSDSDDPTNSNMASNEEPSDFDALQGMLDKAMQKTKLAQQRQFPPAPLWQAVFNTLQSRNSNDEPLLVNLPNQAQYAAISQLLGAGLGQLGQIDNQTRLILCELLAIDSGLNSDEQNKALAQALFDIGEIDVEGVLAYQVRHPAKAFLRTQEVHIVQGEEAMAQQEPLFLDSLSSYQINDYLIHELASHSVDNDSGSPQSLEDTSSQAKPALLYQKIMPAGVARHTTLPNQQQKLQQQCQAFEQQLIANGIEVQQADVDLPIITPSIEHPVQLDLANVLKQKDNGSLLSYMPKMMKIKGVVPVEANGSGAHLKAGVSYAEQSPKHWFNILPNSASPIHLLKFWLSHLYWQVARRTTAEQVALNDGISIWRFNKASTKVKNLEKATAFKLEPIVYEDAVIELIKWAIFAKLSGQVPLTLLPEYALSYLDNCLKAQEDEGAEYWPKRGDFSEWLFPSYMSDMVYDTCSQHAIWQYILRDQDAFKALAASLTALAQPLYEPMFNALDGLKD